MSEAIPDWLNTTLASDAAKGQGVINLPLYPLDPHSRIAAPAFVVQSSRDDNEAVRRAAASDGIAGCVVIVAGHTESRTATIGDLMALEFQNAGAVGLITDGLIRDSLEIIQLGFPVWSRGRTPIASAKHDAGTLGEPITLGGVVIRQGDLVIADADGVVVWPQENTGTLLAQAQTKLDADTQRLATLREASKRT